MSHITNVLTKIKDYEVLIQCLNELGIIYTVTGTEGNRTINAGRLNIIEKAGIFEFSGDYFYDGHCFNNFKNELEEKQKGVLNQEKKQREAEERLNKLENKLTQEREELNKQRTKKELEKEEQTNKQQKLEEEQKAKELKRKYAYAKVMKEIKNAGYMIKEEKRKGKEITITVEKV